MGLFSFLKKKNTAVSVTPVASVISDGYQSEYFDGGKYYGGFGPTKLFTMDYWTLRARSAQLFRENLYARGLIRRLVTNEINIGLAPEVIPNEALLGVAEDSLGDWSESVEDIFAIWADDPKLCDTTLQSDFGKLQRIARAEAIITGDVLIVMRLDRKTGLPRIQIIDGANVVTPLGDDIVKASGSRIEYGVELNQFNQQIAYHVRLLDGSAMRIPARGSQSGRRVAWLLYGCDKRVGDVRGEPLLSIVIQSLKEIDRYRDATQRKAAINAILAMFMKKTQDKIGTKPISNGAVRKKSVEVTDVEGTTRKYNIANQIPGLVIEDLQVGEEPVAFGNQGVDTNYGEFEAAMIHAIAWATEVPPEILQLAFSSNYSASQAAINEFKSYLNKIRAEFGSTFCRPIYQEWLLSEVLAGRIKAPGLLEAWRNPLEYVTYGAWVATDWSGAIKPSTDILKQAKGYELMRSRGWITNARATRELTGTKFSRNMRIIGRENQLQLDAGLVIEPDVPLENADTTTNEDEDSNNG